MDSLQVMVFGGFDDAGRNFFGTVLGGEP